MREPLVWRRIHWAQPLDEAPLRAILTGIAARPTRRSVVLELRAELGRAVYLIGAVPQAMSSLQRTVEGLSTGSVLSELERPRRSVASVRRLHVTGAAAALDTTALAAHIRSLLHAVTAANKPGELAVAQIVLGPGNAPREPAVGPDPTQGLGSLLFTGVRAASPAVQGRLAAKHQEHIFRATIRIGVRADTEPRRQSLGLGIFAALRSLRTPGTGLAIRRDLTSALDSAAIPLRWPIRLSVSEVLALSAWPIGDGPLPGLPSGHPKLLRADATSPATSGVFATSDAPGPRVPLGIEVQDRVYHTLLLGPTGTGKSSAMLHLILDDLRAGRSVVLLDPQANLVRDVLERIPQGRADDVVVLDPTQPRPVGLNPLVAPGVAPDLVSDHILAVFKTLFGASFGPRTTDVMHASLLTLARHGQAALTWLPRLLTDPAFRRQLTRGLDDPIGLDAFWAQYESYSPAQQAQVIAPTLSRLRQLLLRPSLRGVLGQVDPRFVPSDVFTRPRILLVSLNSAVLGPEAARLLGSLLVAGLWQQTLARGGVPRGQRHPVSIYLDEAQEVLHLPLDIAAALARSRAMNVSWVIAHQFRHQFPPDVLASIDANTRNKIVFRLEPADASAMAKFAPELEAIDFQSLDRYEVYARLLRAGRVQSWVSGRTLPPPPPCADELQLRAQSQARYGQQVAEPDVSTRPANRPGQGFGRVKRRRT